MELISNFSKVVGCKVNIQKLILFLNTNNKQIEFEIQNTIGRTHRILGQ